MFQSIGNLLDLPGSGIRDLLSGRNPFDQLLDPFGDTDRTSGQEMLGMMGMGPTAHPILGGGLEMALDPLSYLGIGLAGNAIKGGVKGAQALFKTAKGINTASKAKAAIKSGFTAARSGGRTAATRPFSRVDPAFSSLSQSPVFTMPSSAANKMRNLGQNALDAAYNPAIRNPVAAALMVGSAQSGRNANELTPDELAYLMGG